MGCCSQRRHAEQAAAALTQLDSVPAQEMGRVTVKVVLKELHLTKNMERVTKETCSLSLRVKINESVCESRVMEGVGQHLTWREELKTSMNREDEVAEVMLLAHRGAECTELGYGTVDLEPLPRLKKLGGSVQLHYRCTKSATLICEFCAPQSMKTLDSNYMTLGSAQPQPAVLTFFPPKEYPLHLTSRLRTPQFTSRSFATSSSADHASAQDHDSRALITRIKDQKTTVEELLELLQDERPEVIYYVGQRLQFFASQTNYSRLLLERAWTRLAELMTLLSQDQWVSLQLLWLVFRLLDHMPEVKDRQNKRLEEAGSVALAAAMRVWKELLSVEVTSLAIEVVVRLVSDGPQKTRLNSLCQNFNLITLLFDTLSKFKSTQIVSPVLILTCEVLDIPNKYEYV